jgi:hypothetical protein
MPRYLIERTFNSSTVIPFNNNGETDRLSFINNNSDCNATWLHSYMSDDKRKLFCIYDAPTPEAVRKAAARNKLPVDKITEVLVLEPYFYK